MITPTSALRRRSCDGPLSWLPARPAVRYVPGAMPRIAALLVIAACTGPASAPTTGPSSPVATGSAQAPPPRPAVAPTPARFGGRVELVPLEGAFVATRVEQGDDMRCAISREGRIACWGHVENDDDSTAVERRGGLSRPHLLVGIEGAIDVAMEWFYLCVAQREGAGDGGCFVTSDIGRPAPRFPSPPVELASADVTMCARMRDGNVGCFDANGKYTEVAGARGATALACVARGCCALTATGSVCFGDQPPSLPPLTDVTSVAAGHEDGCARTAAGGARCWGKASGLTRTAGVRDVGLDKDRQVCLVLDSKLLHCVGGPVAEIVDVIDLAGECVVTSDGAVRCTGGNDHGELGDGALMLSAVPLQVPGLDQVVEINVAHAQVCARRRDDAMWCWGPAGPVDRGPVGGTFVAAQYVAGCVNTGSSIRCGAMTSDDQWREQRYVPRVKTIKTAAIHRDSTVCVVDARGKLSCRHGMSDAGLDDRWVPLRAPAQIVELAPLAVGFCARHASGKVSCFEDRRYDDDDDYLDKLPTGRLELVKGIDGATKLVTGASEACVIRSDRTVWCWNVPAGRPGEMTALKGATSLAGNDHHLCAVVAGEVWCWGNGFEGQLGDGTGTGRIHPAKLPVRASLPVKAVQVGTGRESTCALDEHGKVWCWGSNRYGQLGPARLPHNRGWSKVLGLGGG